MVEITIITPTFNSIRYIEQNILNVIDNNVNAIEHLIIDGGSTDGTLEIIKKYAEKYPHINWLSEKDNGQSDAMNKGIKLAKGEYVGFLNVDDSYSNGTLNWVLNKLNGSKIKFIVGNCNVKDENGNLIYVSKPLNNSFFSFYFKQTYPINPVSYFYKKEIHEKTGYYNESEHFAMDC